VLDLATEANDLLPCALAENGGAGPFTNPRKGDCIYGMFARASGFSPNLNNPPFFVDLPIDNSGKLIDSTWAKWLEHNPAWLAKNYLAGARPPLAIYFDCGRQDDALLLAEAVAFDDSLQQLGLAHEFQTYNGDHTNRLRQRFGIALAYFDSVMYAGIARSRTVSASPSYILPGVGSVMIQANVDNPLSHALRVVALINSLDQAVKDSVLLYDDGAHNDGAAADGLWAGSWLAGTGEKIYDVNVKTTDEVIGAAHIKYHAARFTTAGPVAIAGLIIDPADTVANPGDAFTFKLVLRNNSASVTAASVTADVSSSEACVAGIAISFPNYGNLAPGKTAETEGFYVLNIAPNCTDKEILLVVNIASEGFMLWQDSLRISVLTTGIAERKSGAPEQFLLEQNYPNPFNPETKINYQLPKAGRVVLKIFNMLGEEVRGLVDEFKPAGSFEGLKQDFLFFVKIPFLMD
jgi:hypothetical protein